MAEFTYEWHEPKRQSNLEKHDIDFMDALEVFERPHMMIQSDRNGEERWCALGLIGTRKVVVVFAPRGQTRRLISVRAARNNERQDYDARFTVGAKARAD